mmetsp:Transcript_26977/g.38013  ORF Transcript_26977/g.38013 Transcript_26977/m.38013 type:complete len:454 (+) Transcript_26977:52-1413(+)
MPRGKKRDVSDDEEEEVDFLDDDDEPVDYDDDDSDDGRSFKRQKSETSDSNAGGSLRRSARAVAKEKASELPFGSKWREDESLIVLTPKKHDNAPQQYGSKIAAFDLDSTLIATKSGRTFPTGRSDWKWLYEEIPKKLQELHKNGYKVVVFTNQGGVESGNSDPEALKGKIIDIIKEIEVPLFVVIATATDLYRKPAVGMWDYFVQTLNDGVEVDKTQSVYVGDAAGRPAQGKKKKDHSCVDRKFAHNIGLEFFTPEEYFLGEAKTTNFDWGGFNPTTYQIKDDDKPFDGTIASQTQELIINVGPPASGKSFFSKTYLVPNGYIHVNQDTFKSKQKCLEVTTKSLAEGKSVIVDNTNPTKDVRQEYIAIAKKSNIPVRCFWYQTPLDLANHLNMYREKITSGERSHVPKVVYATFNKKFEEPNTEEGFSEVVKVNFVPKFENDDHKKVFFQFT